MKYLTKLLLLVSVAISAQMAMAEVKPGTETFIMLKNNTNFYMWLSNLKDSNGKPIEIKGGHVAPHTKEEGEKFTFPLGDKGSTDIKIGDKDGKVLHTWGNLTFNKNGQTRVPGYEIKDEKFSIGGYIQVSDYRVYDAKDTNKKEFHNYTIELQEWR